MKTYNLIGSLVHHVVRSEAPTYVQALCGAMAHASRREMSPLPKEGQYLCPDCKALYDADKAKV